MLTELIKNRSRILIWECVNKRHFEILNLVNGFTSVVSGIIFRIIKCQTTFLYGGIPQKNGWMSTEQNSYLILIKSERNGLLQKKVYALSKKKEEEKEKIFQISQSKIKFYSSLRKHSSINMKSKYFLSLNFRMVFVSLDHPITYRSPDNQSLAVHRVYFYCQLEPLPGQCMLLFPWICRRNKLGRVVSLKQNNFPYQMSIRPQYSKLLTCLHWWVPYAQCPICSTLPRARLQGPVQWFCIPAAWQMHRNPMDSLPDIKWKSKSCYRKAHVSSVLHSSFVRSGHQVCCLHLECRTLLVNLLRRCIRRHLNQKEETPEMFQQINAVFIDSAAVIPNR